MNRIIPILAALALLSAACTKEIHENGAVPGEQHNLTGKLVGGTDGDIVPGTVLVKLDEASVAKIEAGRFNEISEELFGEIKPVSFTYALPAKPKNEELAKKFGLHQWFSVQFDEAMQPSAVASRLAKSKAVRAVQYEKYIKPISSEKTIILENSPVTRAAAQEGYFNDPHSSWQWNLHNDGKITKGARAGADAGVRDAWRLTAGDPSVIVAVFDCAVNNTHEDLKDAVWQNEGEIANNGIDDDGNGFIDDKYGFNFVKCISINEDYTNNLLEGKEVEAVKGNPLNWVSGFGHGTHVAGIIGATNNNGVGVSSIAGGTGKGDGVRLMTCQIFDGPSGTSDARSAAAFIYAADNGACIAQCSYGNTSDIRSDELYINGDSKKGIKSATLENAAILYFINHSNHPALEGNIAVFSAGNNTNHATVDRPYSMYPGALPHVLSVTAIQNNFMPAPYTHYGPGSKIAAPGGDCDLTVLGEHAMSRDWSDEFLGEMILSTGVAEAIGTNSSLYPGVNDNGKEDKSYRFMLGTSMACPHVSGVLALGISYAHKLGKKLTREQMTSMLLSSVDNLDSYTSGTKYHKKMGTGLVDAWNFLMAIEGTPSVVVGLGQKKSIDLSTYCNPSLDYTVSMDEAGKESLGLVSELEIKDGMIEIECSKVGAGKIVLSASVGKDPETDKGIGAMNYSREISIVSREFATNNGGWL